MALLSTRSNPATWLAQGSINYMFNLYPALFLATKGSGEDCGSVLPG
jgi:hypothetical protein